METILFLTLGHHVDDLWPSTSTIADLRGLHVFHPRGQQPGGRRALAQLRRRSIEAGVGEPILHAVAGPTQPLKGSGSNADGFLTALEQAYGPELAMGYQIFVKAEGGTQAMRWAAATFAIVHGLALHMGYRANNRSDDPYERLIPASYHRLRELHETKWRLLRRIAVGGNVLFRVLHEVVGGSQANVSAHLRGLEDLGLVVADRHGRVSTFSASRDFPAWLFRKDSRRGWPKSLGPDLQRRDPVAAQMIRPR